MRKNCQEPWLLAPTFSKTVGASAPILTVTLVVIAESYNCKYKGSSISEDWNSAVPDSNSEKI